MTADEAIAVIESLEAAGIRVWLDGGWGVDALLGEQTRDHDDVDVVLPLEDVDRAIVALSALGFAVTLDERPTRLVLEDAAGRRIDVHPIVLDGDGSGRQIGAGPDGSDAPYPAEGLAGRGRVGGRQVACLTPELLLLHHRGYAPTSKDRRDVSLLCERFGLALPREYGDEWPDSRT
jgi:lincosamide nucleotidyltransferase A/C/D/E